jgi:hypothetical protein
LFSSLQKDFTMLRFRLQLVAMLAAIFSPLHNLLTRYMGSAGLMAYAAPNTLTNLIPTLYAAADIVSREQIGFIPAVTRDSRIDRVAINQTVNVPVVGAITPVSITPGAYAPDTGGAAPGNVTVTISNQYAAPIAWNGDEQIAVSETGLYDNVVTQRFAQGMRAIANLVEADLAALHTKASRAYGTYNAAPGTAPSFASATGWTFVAASSQYLTTGIIPASGWSMIVRYSGATGSGTVIVGSRVTGNETRFRFQWNDGTGVNYGSGGSVTVAPPLAAGVLGVAGQQGYRNGTADGGAISAWSGTGVAVYIGAQNLDGAAQLFASVSIQALAIYNTTLTASQILAVSNAMAAL